MSHAEMLQLDAETESQKRQQILDGARRVFMAQGFDGASMNDIVKAASVSKGTVYAYFPSKEKLFESLVFHDKRRQAEAMMTVAMDGRPMPEVLYDLGIALARNFRTPDNVAYARMAIGVASKFPAIGRAIYEGGPAFAIERVSEYFEHKMADGALKRRDAKLLASQFIDLVQSGITKPCLFGVESMAEKMGLETVVASAIELFLSGAVNGPSAAPDQTA